MKASATGAGAEPYRLPVGEAFVEDDIDGRNRQHGSRGDPGEGPRPAGARGGKQHKQIRHHGRGERRERNVPIARVENETDRGFERDKHQRHQRAAQRPGKRVKRLAAPAQQRGECRHWPPRREGRRADDWGCDRDCREGQ